MSDDKRKDLEREFGDSYNASSLGGELGLRGVRISPSQYLGSRGIEGAVQAALEIIQNSVDEAAELLAFFTKHGVSLEDIGKFVIEIEIDKEDIVKVKDTGRGVPADFSEKFKRPVVEAAFEEINVGGKGHGYVEDGKSAYLSKTIGKHGSGAACANATSDFFYVDTYTLKDKKHYRVEWEEAYKTKAMTFVKDITDGKHGTEVVFKPSKEVFQMYSDKRRGEVSRFYHLQDIQTFLTEYAYNTENIIFKFKYQDENGVWSEHEYDSDAFKPTERIAPYAKKQIHSAKIEDPEFGYSLDVHIGVAKSRQTYLTSNMVTLKSGTHLTVVHDVLESVEPEVIKKVNEHLAQQKGGVRKEINRLLLEKARIGSPYTYVSMYLSIFMDDPDYTGQSKDELNSPRITQSLERHFSDALYEGALTEFRKELVDEMSRIAIHHFEREESYRREAEHKKKLAERREREKAILGKNDPGAIKGMSEEDKNLTRAREQDLKKVTLFMVEGNTAHDALAEAREVQTEAIYSVVERPPNVFIHSDNKLWKKVNNQGKEGMKKFRELYKVLYGNKKGDYRAIVLSTDNDADGGLIKANLIGFIFKYFPNYINEGRLYEFLAPKFSGERKHENGEIERVFLYSRDERKKHYEETKGTFSYVSYKGMGSIPTEVLRELLDSGTALVPFNPKTYKEGMYDLIRFLTDTKYKQEYVLEHYGSEALYMFKKSRKEILKNHELEYDVNALEEQFTLEHNFSELETTTFMERLLLSHNESEADLTAEDEEMFLDSVITDDYDEETIIEIDSDIDSED